MNNTAYRIYTRRGSAETEVGVESGAVLAVFSPKLPERGREFLGFSKTNFPEKE
jgi:hypothetical protein